MAVQEKTHARPIYFIRWRNFRSLLESRRTTITASAALLGKSQSQVSNFGGRNPGKAIGSQLAADIEAAFGLVDGWLDRDGATDRAEIDEALLGQVEDWLQFEESALGKYKPVSRLQRALALIQMIQSDGGRLSPAHAAELVSAIR